MTELEMSTTLGLLLEPEKNRVHLSPELNEDIQMITGAFSEMTQQKSILGNLYSNMWLEFIPWHSLN